MCLVEWVWRAAGDLDLGRVRFCGGSLGEYLLPGTEGEGSEGM